MAWGNIRVRNACPFPVTFYAIAGPSIELASMQTSSASACLIWFSTRVKGPGNTIDQGTFEALQEEYIKQLQKDGHSATDVKGGGYGAAAGSLLGVVAGALESVFKVKNTELNAILYFGAKKEGVYGNSNLVVYATLDPACRLDANLPKIWSLHLESDSGQQTPSGDTYEVPDLSKYKDTMFVRAKNVRLGSYLCATGDGGGVGVQGGDNPFNPLEFSTYWTLSPTEAGAHNLKLLNVKTQKWMTCFSSDSNKMGLLSLGYADYSDQHWNAQIISSNPEVVMLTNVYVQKSLVGTPDGGTYVYYTNAGYTDQRWTVETFTVDVDKVPPGHTFRIMHCKTGQYITMGAGETDRSTLQSTSNEDQLFVVEKFGEGDYRFRNTKYNVYLTFFQNWKYLGGYTATGVADQHWSAPIVDNNAGFRLCNRTPSFAGSNQLYHNETGFGLWSGDFPDQLWVLQLESMS